MNLSNYLQMPPAPAASQPTQTGPATGTGSVVGLDSAGQLKLDFAQIMARQFQQMPQLKRQDLAAASSLPKLTSLSKDLKKASNDSSNEEDTASSSPQVHTNDRLGTRSDSHAYLKNGVPQSRAADQTDAQNNDSPAHASRKTSASTTQADTEAWREVEAMLRPFGWTDPTNTVTVTAAAPVTPSADPLAAVQSTHLPDDTPLQTVALSPQTQLITDPRHAPNPQSLMAFAQSMGLSPEAIGQLMGNSDMARLAAQAGQTASNLQTTTPAELTGNLNQTLSAQQSATPLQASLTAAMQANGMGNQTHDAAAMLTSMTATQVQAQSVGTPSQAVHAPATPLVSTLQMLTPADPNAALNGAMQVNMLPVAPAVVAAQTGAGSVASALDVIDLRTGDLSESSIGALTGLLAESTQNDGASLSQDSSSGSDQPSNSFAQALAGQTDTRSNTDASKATEANRGANASMSEAYDRLSEKLSNEMAARMHAQINAGQWKMKFGLRPAHLGGVEVQLEMKDGKLNAQLQTDNPLTRELLQSSSQRLRDALANLGVQTSQVTVGQNASGFAQTGSQGQSGGNPAQVGDNLASNVRPDEATPEMRNSSSAKGSDSLLDLYA